MNPILEKAEILEHVKPLSVSGFHRLIDLGELDRGVELIEGVLVEKMSKSPLHRYVVNQLLNLLRTYCKSRELTVFKEDPLTLEASEPEPDLAVVRGRQTDFVSAHPHAAELVVEVAISSLPIDQAKARVYAGAGVPEFWLIRPHDREIDVYRDPSPNGYGELFTARTGQILASVALTDFAIDPNQILPDREAEPGR